MQRPPPVCAANLAEARKRLKTQMGYYDANVPLNRSVAAPKVQHTRATSQISVGDASEAGLRSARFH
jgi:hypothetical protein